MNLPAALLLLQIASPVAPLDRVGQVAEKFWDQFTTVQSVERVMQARLKEDGKAVSTQIAEFDYVALLKTRGGGVAVEESRVPRASAAKSSGAPASQWMLTSGFPAFMLLFHPNYRQRFEFQESPDAGSPNGTIRVAFKSRPAEQSLSAMKLKDRLYPILWRGFAWIDVATGAVTRIEAGLDRSMEDIGLAELQAEVEYRAVLIEGESQSYYLPARVTVSLRTAAQRWKNVHEFSGYKLFTVTSSTRGEIGDKSQ